MGSEGSERSQAGKESGQGAGGVEGLMTFLLLPSGCAQRQEGHQGSGLPVTCASFPTAAGASFWLLNLVYSSNSQLTFIPTLALLGFSYLARERESCVAQNLGKPAFKKMGGPCHAWWSKGLDWSWGAVGVQSRRWRLWVGAEQKR